MAKKRERILVDCACGLCGMKVENYDKKGRPRLYVSGHNTKGKQLSEQARNNISEGRKGIIFSESHRKRISEVRIGKGLREENHNWKGMNIGLSALHKRIRTYLPRPELCVLCNKVPPIDVSNKSGKYLHDLSDWQWICKKCHYHYDDLGTKMWTTRRKKMVVVRHE